jgi:hypothetical protein
MSCDDTQCLPPRDVEFSVVIGGGESTAVADGSGATGTVTYAPDNQQEGLSEFFLLSMLTALPGYSPRVSSR